MKSASRRWLAALAVGKLIEAGADLNARTDSGNLPLAVAATAVVLLCTVLLVIGILLRFVNVRKEL